MYELISFIELDISFTGQRKQIKWMPYSQNEPSNITHSYEDEISAGETNKYVSVYIDISYEYKIFCWMLLVSCVFIESGVLRYLITCVYIHTIVYYCVSVVQYLCQFNKANGFSLCVRGDVFVCLTAYKVKFILWRMITRTSKTNMTTIWKK